MVGPPWDVRGRLGAAPSSCVAPSDAPAASALRRRICARRVEGQRSRRGSNLLLAAPAWGPGQRVEKEKREREAAAGRSPVPHYQSGRGGWCVPPTLSPLHLIYSCSVVRCGGGASVRRGVQGRCTDSAGCAHASGTRETTPCGVASVPHARAPRSHPASHSLVSCRAEGGGCVVPPSS